MILTYSAFRMHFNLKVIVTLIFPLVFLATLAKPDIGFIIIIISMLFSPDVVVGLTMHRPVSIRIEDVLLLVIIFAWFVRIAFTKDIAKTFSTKLTAPFFLYIAACVASSILALIFSEIDIKLAFLSTLKYLQYFLLFLMVKDNMRSPRQLKLFVAGFLLVALAVSLHSSAFIQQKQTEGVVFFRTAPPVETRGGGESGTLGGYLVFMMAIAGGLLLYTRSVPFKIFLICLELAMFKAFLYTLSRGSYLALIPAAIALAYFTKKGKTILVYTLFVGSILLGLFMPHMVRERIFTTITMKEDVSGYHVALEESAQERVSSWKVVMFERFPKSPLFGHGVAKFFIDGQIFLTLCEVGLLGFILFCWVLARLFKMAKEALDTEEVKSDGFSSGISVGFLAGFIGLLSSAISTNTFLIIRIMEPFWFIAAIVLSLPRLLEKEEAREDR